MSGEEPMLLESPNKSSIEYRLNGTFFNESSVSSDRRERPKMHYRMNADTIFCHAGDYQATNATTIIGFVQVKMPELFLIFEAIVLWCFMTDI